MIVYQTPSRTFSSDLEILECCGQVESINVVVSNKLDEKLRAMEKEVSDVEWFGYLIGIYDQDSGTARLTDVIIPEQTGSGAGVDNIVPPDDFTNILGTVHYFSGGLHWSSSDEETLRGNHDINLVYHQGKYLCKARIMAPCGYHVKVKGEVSVDSRWKDWIKTNAKKINRATHSWGLGNGLGGWSGHWNPQWWRDKKGDKATIPTQEKEEDTPVILLPAEKDDELDLSTDTFSCGNCNQDVCVVSYPDYYSGPVTCPICKHITHVKIEAGDIVELDGEKVSDTIFEADSAEVFTDEVSCPKCTHKFPKETLEHLSTSHDTLNYSGPLTCPVCREQFKVIINDGSLVSISYKPKTDYMDKVIPYMD